jgi:hypothetical protein
MNESIEERRAASRGKAKIAVELLHERLKDAVTQTYDYSDTGVLVENMPGSGILCPGMEIKIRITGIMGLPTQILAARVVRIDDEGIALEFKEPIATN